MVNMESFSCALLFFSIVITLQLQKAATSCPPPENILPCRCSTYGPVLTCKGFNRVKEIPFSSFKGRTYNRLILEDGRMSKFPTDVFQGLSIRHIELKNLQITSLTLMEDFQGLAKSLQTLTLEETNVGTIKASNKISHNDEFRYFYTLRMEGSTCLLNESLNYIGISNLKQFICTGNPEGQNSVFISDFLLATFSNLEEVNLGGTKVRNVKRDTFPVTAQKLKIINLRDNNLSELDKLIFTNMPALRELYLQGNMFKSLDRHTFKPVWNQLTHIYLNDNPVKCNCDIGWLIVTKKPTNLIYPTCAFPPQFVGVSLKDVEIDDVCSWWWTVFV
ncbi:vasorin-like [Limulus polyphemus]|uniref:Vasorin-like n=1 Tax=Limulus polyphemus TaxID=6850 RepID=A0ABM1S4I1_LIMPO|nr:vasorin-like [Limulus polyphemus]